MAVTKVFARQGNYTAVDNAVLDQLMVVLNGNEFKLLMAIIRRTVGWHELEVRIGQREFMAITGIGSFSTVTKGLAKLVAMGIIIRSDAGQRVIYSLNRDFELETATESVAETATETVAVDKTATKSVADTATESVAGTATETVAASIYIKKGKERGKNARAREGARSWVANGIPRPEGEEEEAVVNHPAICAWMAAGFEWPGYDIAPSLVDQLGEQPDVDLLIRSKKMWELSGNKRTNYLGILDWYDELRVDPDWSPGPVRSNGRSPAKPKEPAPAQW